MEISAERAKGVPRRLKPGEFCCSYGTTEVVPFQSRDFFRSV
jgi:hypothetical protein